MDELRTAFVLTGYDDWLRRCKVGAKYLKMRLEGVTYPDVYCLARFFAKRWDFLCEGDAVKPGKYDLIMSELPGAESQLQFLAGLVKAAHTPVAIIPGPPEILERVLDDKRTPLVRFLLSEAPHVLAYSQEVRSYVNGLIGSEKARIIPWPFDYEGTVRIGRGIRLSKKACRVVMQVPLRFCGVTRNHPFELKSVLMKAVQALPHAFRERLSFHTFTYTKEDTKAYWDSRFAEGLPVKLEPKRGYRSFVKFLAGSDAVVNLTVGGVLGRITFLSAALGKPGIFSANSETNQALYPDSVGELADGRLYSLLLELLLGLAEGATNIRFAPNQEAARRMGDFEQNARRMRALMENDSGRAGVGRSDAISYRQEDYT